MIRRLYVHNFRCLENFELPAAGKSSLLLIGKNGSGKSTVGCALEVLQKIARGANRVRELVKPTDLSRGRADVPLRFEIEVEIAGRAYGYSIAFELPDGFKELRVLDEKLTADGLIIYSRELSEVHLVRSGEENEANFRVDWHLVALPIVQERSKTDPLFVFKRWLAQMLILRPVPCLITGDSDAETLEPSPRLADFGSWFSGLLAYAPAAYRIIEEYLKQAMPDLKEIKNPATGKDARSLNVHFANHQGSFSVAFNDLSDGEKCFLICSVVLAANDSYGPLCCFWDEPDSHLSLSEVGDFIVALRRGFQAGGQFIATSHNPEAIRRFSDENTLVMFRRNHLEPTLVRPLSDLEIQGDLVGALIRDDLEP